jgi:hypothetical protein
MNCLQRSTFTRCKLRHDEESKSRFADFFTAQEANTYTQYVSMDSTSGYMDQQLVVSSDVGATSLEMRSIRWTTRTAEKMLVVQVRYASPSS